MFRGRILQHHCSKPQTLSLSNSQTLSPRRRKSPLPYTDNSRPVFRYVSGNSVPLTIAVSGGDFDELVANHARESDQFYDFLPPMPPPMEHANYKIAPLIALQVTLFPGSGICIGLNNHHSLGDERSLAGFMKAWATINKSGDDVEFVSRNAKSLPIFDRSVFGDCSRVDDIFWNTMKKTPLKPAPSHPLPINRVRASFLLHQSDIKKLKDLVSSAKPELFRVSTFVVAAAYVWTALAKSGDSAGDEDDVFVFPADGSGRLNALFDPPAPVNYFGNCLGGGAVRVERRKLAADDGLVVAAEAIDDKIKTEIYDGKEFLKNPENRLSEMPKLKGKRVLVAFGSPKFDLTEADFGWGEGRKVEVLSLDGRKYAMSLCKSGGGLVVGLSLPKEMMDAFALVFKDGLNS